VGVRRLDRPRVQDIARPLHEIVGVERSTRDVQRRALMRQRYADNRLRGSFGQRAHALASSPAK
jgi:hypothetical protein